MAAGAAVAFLALTVAVLARARPLLGFDAAVSDAALRTALAHPGWRSAMSAVTMTGSTGVLGPIAAVACLVALWRRRLRAAAFIAVTLPVTLAIRLLVVNAVHRSRPADRLAPAAGWSFHGRRHGCTDHGPGLLVAGASSLGPDRDRLSGGRLGGGGRSQPRRAGRALAQRRRRRLAAGAGGGTAGRRLAAGHRRPCTQRVTLTATTRPTARTLNAGAGQLTAPGGRPRGSSRCCSWSPWPRRHAGSAPCGSAGRRRRRSPRCAAGGCRGDSGENHPTADRGGAADRRDRPCRPERLRCWFSWLSSRWRPSPPP